MQGAQLRVQEAFIIGVSGFISMALEPISASDLERFGYCPLSWWLGKQAETTSSELSKGEVEHSALAKDLDDIVNNEREAKSWERIVLMFSIVASIMAIIGISFMSFENEVQVSMVLGGLSLVWLVASIILLYISLSIKDSKERARTNMVVAGFSIVAVVIALNAVSILNVNPELALIVEAVALIWMIGASLALYQSIKLDRSALLIREKRAVKGEINYIDRGRSRMLRSERLGLQGRPDYILEIEGELVPVDLKSGRTPRGPLFSHIMQVSAYCLLLQEEGKNVTHGILRYKEAEHEVEFNEDMRKLVLSKLDEMRELGSTGKVHRNHNRPGKCHSCSRREACPERLE